MNHGNEERMAGAEPRSTARARGGDADPLVAALRRHREAPPDLTRPPPPRRWLLRHPGEAGEGLVPLGEVGILAADGGVGKTTGAVGLAGSVALGRRWLDHFVVGEDAVNRRCLVVLAEDTDEDCHRRLYRVCEALGLNARDRRMLVERVDIVGMTGRDVELATVDRRTGQVRPTSRFEHLQRYLAGEGGEDGWALVVLDPLARFAPPEAETDNGVASRMVGMLEGLKSAPGEPAVIALHHASLDGVRNGSIRSRGATGLRNGARWEAYLRRDDHTGEVFFRLAKSNVSMTMRRELPVTWDRGVLRVVSEAERERQNDEREAVQNEAALKRAEAKAEAKRQAALERAERDVEAVVDAIRTAGPEGLPNRDVVGARAGVPDRRCRAALAEAETRGLIVKAGSTKTRRIVATEHATDEGEA